MSELTSTRIVMDEKDLFSIEYAMGLDEMDELSSFRSEFLFPKIEGHSPVIYLCGNSLGLQPKNLKQEVAIHLDKWADEAVEGHFTGENMWVEVESLLQPAMASLVGALPSEVVLMNSLTANLHLMMVAFYQPTPTRHKILIEKKAFPSDYHAVISQIQLHGYGASSSLIEVEAREGELILNEDDVESLLQDRGHEIALVLFSGIQYYTGQFFDLQRITKCAQKAGCKVGFDLAHAVGNVPLLLHDWGCDFACWCSYKYMNCGPGSIAGCFVHERHGKAELVGEGEYKSPLPRRLGGWWGHRTSDRFHMAPQFVPNEGANGFRLSNPPVLLVACAKASLDVFSKAGIDHLRAKSIKLTNYLEQLIDAELKDRVEIFTPRQSHRRGCQLSLSFKSSSNELIKVDDILAALKARGVICDARKPNVLRIAPTPLYNSFQDVFHFVYILKDVLQLYLH